MRIKNNKIKKELKFYILPIQRILKKYLVYFNNFVSSRNT